MKSFVLKSFVYNAFSFQNVISEINVPLKTPKVRISLRFLKLKEKCMRTVRTPEVSLRSGGSYFHQETRKKKNIKTYLAKLQKAIRALKIWTDTRFFYTLSLPFHLFHSHAPLCLEDPKLCFISRFNRFDDNHAQYLKLTNVDLIYNYLITNHLTNRSRTRKYNIQLWV